MERLPLFRHACATLAVMVALATFAGAAKVPTIISIDVPNATGTIPRAINNSGKIAGDYYDANGRYRGFLLQRNNRFVTLNLYEGTHPERWQTRGVGINVSGDMVGYMYGAGASELDIGYIRETNGKMIFFQHGGDVTPPVQSLQLINPGLPECAEGVEPRAINAFEEVTGSVHCMVGFLRQRDGTGTTFRVTVNGDEDFRDTLPQAINGKTQITGYYFPQGHFAPRGFLRQSDGTVVTFDVPSSNATRPIAINDSGQIAGNYQDTDGVSHGFLREQDGSLTTFDPTGSIATQVTAMNKKSEITGFYATVDGLYHGFLRHTDGTVECFDSPSVPNWGIFPQGINDVGDIVGYYQGSNSELRGFVRSAH